jgi:diguanylate cyclase (GGDEF)-like protein/PAS domain S-box-containing protein
MIEKKILDPIGTVNKNMVWLGVPLKIENKVIGAMAVQSYTNPQLYSEKDIKLMEFVSSQVATAIDRKQMEEKLRESQKEFASLFRSSPEAMVYLDDKRNIININSRFTNLFGYTLEEVKGRNINDGMIHSKDRIEEGEEFDNTIRLKSYINYESIRKKKNGMLFFVSISASPVSINGKTLGILGMYEDITIRKEVEEKLKNSEKRFKTLFDSAPEAYYSSTNKGVFIDGNKAAEKLIGYKREELVGSNFLKLKLLSPIQILKASKLLVRNSLGKPTGPDEFTLRRKDGKKIEIEISTYPLKESKDKYLILGIAHDIEKHKELEKKLEHQVLERTKKLTTLNRQLKKEINYHKKLENEFKESEERFKLLSESSFEGILIHNKGKVIDTNQVLADMFGMSTEEVKGKSLFKFVTPGTALTVAKNMILKNTGLYEGKGINVKGKIFPIEIQAKTIPYKNKTLRVAAIRDISFREEAEKKIRKSEEKYRILAEMLPEAVFETNEEGKISYCNVLGYKMFGYCESDFIRGVNILQLIAPRDHFIFKKETEKLYKSKKPKIMTYNALKKDGTKIKIEVHSNPILNEKGEPIGIRGIGMDVTKKRKGEKKIKYLSYHDKLTGLYNRAFFEEELIRLDTERQLPLTIIIGDINGLKLINDTFGHAKGDVLIKTISRILKKCFRNEDIVARWGGDEFSIILPHTSFEKSTKIIERVKKKCEKKSSQKLPLNISLGTATKKTVDEKVSAIIKEAEDKMYRYKLLERKSAHSSILFSLKKALEERDYETEAHANRLVKFSVALGKKIHLPDSKINELQLLAALHDIGKIAIADNILLKPGKLSEKEWVEIRKHSEVGYRIALSSPDLTPIAEGILSHHERWDGKGYPQGIKGENIPLIARIISIADAYDAMTNDRPYRKALSKEEALAELKKCAGTQFDSELANEFIRIIKDNKVVNL